MSWLGVSVVISTLLCFMTAPAWGYSRYWGKYSVMFGILALVLFAIHSWVY